jgi:hypothetical protein
MNYDRTKSVSKPSTIKPQRVGVSDYDRRQKTHTAARHSSGDIVNDTDTLSQLIDMVVESLDGPSNNNSSVPSSVKNAARAWGKAVQGLLHKWIPANLSKFETSKGPLKGYDAEQIEEKLMDAGRTGGCAPFLYYMEMEGHGIGTWDGDWDAYFVKKSSIDELSKLVETHLHSAYSTLSQAIDEAGSDEYDEWAKENKEEEEEEE